MHTQTRDRALEYTLLPLGSWRPPPQCVDPRRLFRSGTLSGPDQGRDEVSGQNGPAVPLLGTFKAADSGVSGDVVSAPSSKTWIWKKYNDYYYKQTNKIQNVVIHLGHKKSQNSGFDSPEHL